MALPVLPSFIQLLAPSVEARDHLVALQKTQDDVRLCLPLSIDETNVESVALRVGQIRCSDGLCHSYVTQLVSTIMQYSLAKTHSNIWRGSSLLLFCARLSKLLPPVFCEGTAQETSFVRLLLSACETLLDNRHKDRPVKASSLSGEREMRQQVVSFVSSLTAHFPDLLALLSHKLRTFLTTPNAVVTSSSPSLWLDATLPHLMDAKSDPMIAVIYKYAFCYPVPFDRRTRFALQNFCEQWQYHCTPLTAVLRKQFHSARAFLRVVMNARKVAEQQGSPASPLLRLPKDLIVAIALQFAPAAKELRRAYEEEVTRAREELAPTRAASNTV